MLLGEFNLITTTSKFSLFLNCLLGLDQMVWLSITQTDHSTWQMAPPKKEHFQTLKSRKPVSVDTLFPFRVVNQKNAHLKETLLKNHTSIGINPKQKHARHPFLAQGTTYLLVLRGSQGLGSLIYTTNWVSVPWHPEAPQPERQMKEVGEVG